MPSPDTSIGHAPEEVVEKINFGQFWRQCPHPAFPDEMIGPVFSADSFREIYGDVTDDIHLYRHLAQGHANPDDPFHKNRPGMPEELRALDSKIRGVCGFGLSELNTGRPQATVVDSMEEL